MSVTTSFSDDRKTATLIINGSFDFNLHKDFRAAYSQVDAAVQKVVLDMGAVNYMDSSALGMLLLLREHLGGDNAAVEVINCTEEISNILAIANFDKLFTVQIKA